MHQLEHTTNMMAEFHRMLDNTYLQWCPDCSEARLTHVPAGRQRPASDDGQEYTTARCTRCKQERTRELPKRGPGGCLRFSAANDMHPRAPPAHLPALTQVCALRAYQRHTTSTLLVTAACVLTCRLITFLFPTQGLLRWCQLQQYSMLAMHRA
jgi:hypothetical protein